MYLSVLSVHPIEDFKLLLTFENNEKKIFDMKPYLNIGIFSQLRDVKLFETVHVSFDSIEWNNGADLCPEVLYVESEKFVQ